MKISPIKAIRAKCLDCSAGQPSEVRLCQCDDCPLHCFRFGKNPNRAGIGRKSAVFSQKASTQVSITETKRIGGINL